MSREVLQGGGPGLRFTYRRLGDALSRPEDVGYFSLGYRFGAVRHFWLRIRDGWVVAARDDDEGFSDDFNLWQAHS